MASITIIAGHKVWEKLVVEEDECRTKCEEFKLPFPKDGWQGYTGQDSEWFTGFTESRRVHLKDRKQRKAHFPKKSVSPKRDLQMRYNELSLGDADAVNAVKEKCGALDGNHLLLFNFQEQRKPLHPPPRPEEKKSAIPEKSVSPKRDSVAQNKKTKSNQAALEEERNTPPLCPTLL
ncbi:hypothetical protein CBL_05166 [Carabus blaptoides fortunei]